MNKQFIEKVLGQLSWYVIMVAANYAAYGVVRHLSLIPYLMGFEFNV